MITTKHEIACNKKRRKREGKEDRSVWEVQWWGDPP